MKLLTSLALVATLVAVRPQQAATQQNARKKLLFLTHAGLYKHSSLGPAEKAVAEWGKAGGFDVTTLEGYKQDSAKLDLSMITPDYLAQFDGLMLMTNGNLPLTDAQKAGIVDFVKNGKALIGAHCAIAGVTRIEDDVILWAKVVVNKDLVIGPKAVLLATSGVDKSIEGGKTYFGAPAMEARKKWRELAALRMLPDLISKIK